MSPQADGQRAPGDSKPGEVRISVVIPWHRNVDHLRRSVTSVLNQTYPAYEIVVVCNGDVVRSSDAPSEFRDRGVIFVTQATADSGQARNTGIDTASGDYVAFLDADDEFMLAKHASIAEVVSANAGIHLLTHRGIRRRGSGVQWVYPRRVAAPREDLGRYFFSEGNYLSSSAIVASLEVARSVRFGVALARLEDIDFYVRAQAAGYELHMLAEPMHIWHDEETEGRLSRVHNGDSELAWARSMGPLLSESAFAAFCARIVAQHEFPRNFPTSAIQLFRGWKQGRIPLHEIAMMALRGVLPGSIEPYIVDLYFQASHRHTSAVNMKVS